VRVLVAEDDTKSRKILKKTVEGFGHECLLARDGQEAWELYQNTPDVDVVISDREMPGIDGLELCRRIRRANPAGYTFFVFLSAPEEEEDHSVVMRVGADDVIAKPLDSEQLRLKLLTASRVTSLRRRLNRGSKGETNGSNVDTNGRSKEIALRDEGRLRSSGSLSTRRLGLGGIKLWDALIAEGRVTEDQVQLALDAQSSDPRSLRKIMVSLGFISEAELAQVQAQQLKLDYIELTERDVDRDVVGLVPKRILRKHRALPLRIDNVRRLVVAMSDPTDIQALEDLRMASGYKIVPVVATEEDIQRTQAKVLAIGEEVTKLLEDAAGAGVKDHTELDLGVEAGPDEKPIIRLVSSILQQALGDGASDIHIEPRAKELTVRLRVDGVLREVMSIPPKIQSGVIARLKILGNLDIAERRIPQDGRFSVKLAGQKVDLRVASLPTVFGERVVLRLLDTASVEVNLDKLGFAPRTLEHYEKIFRKPSGTTLVTGPTGSGKTTTLYATLRQLNTPEKNIITVEDPVEYRIRGISQVQVNPKAGLTFASGLRSILRNDPDIMMIGEIRDHETAKISVEAALTGHLVLATLHTNNAPAAVNRLTDMGVEPFLTASAVDCVIAQRLARRLCDRCKQPAEIEEEILQSMQFPFEHFDGSDPRFYRAVGCSRCGGSGYRGRVGLYELMAVTEDIRNLVLRRSSTDEIARVAEREGMIRLRDDGLLKAARGITTIEEALRVVL
jgi:type IV pilus assembly protein PilB